MITFCVKQMPEEQALVGICGVWGDYGCPEQVKQSSTKNLAQNVASWNDKCRAHLNFA